MSITTSQQISKYYTTYGNVDVTFTKEVIRTTGLLTKQVYLKFLGFQWPCIIYSSSMHSAKILTNVNQNFTESLKKTNNLLSLRFSFYQSDKPDPVSFFVTAKSTGFSQYNQENKSLHFVTLEYTQRPPDVLIEILGELLEANINSKKRKEERIVLTQDALRKLGIKDKSTFLYIQGVPRKCILRDISFSGAKVLVMGVAKFILNKEATINIEVNDSKEIIRIKGNIIRHEEVQGRKDIAAYAIQFDESNIPIKYKMMINDYLKQEKIKKQQKYGV